MLRQTKMKTILIQIMMLTMLRDEDDKRADEVLDNDKETFMMPITSHPASLPAN